MTIDEIRAIVARCTYKPGWQLIVHANSDGSRPYLQLHVTAAICSVSLEPCEWKSAKHYLSEFMCKQELVGVCFKAIQQAEEHELREFFRYRGVRIFNPHIDPDALVSVAHIEDTRAEPMLMKEGQP